VIDARGRPSPAFLGDDSMKFQAKNGTTFKVAKANMLMARVEAKNSMRVDGTESHTVPVKGMDEQLFCMFLKDGSFQFMDEGGVETTVLYPASALTADVKWRIYSPNEEASNNGRGYWSTKQMSWVEEEKAEEFGTSELIRLGGLPESTGGDARSVRVN
jgi:hypothetical protein